MTPVFTPPRFYWGVDIPPKTARLGGGKIPSRLGVYSKLGGVRLRLGGYNISPRKKKF